MNKKQAKNKMKWKEHSKVKQDSEEKLLRQSAFKLLLSIFAFEIVLVTHLFSSPHTYLYFSPFVVLYIYIYTPDRVSTYQLYVYVYIYVCAWSYYVM